MDGKPQFISEAACHQFCIAVQSLLVSLESSELLLQLLGWAEARIEALLQILQKPFLLRLVAVKLQAEMAQPCLVQTMANYLQCRQFFRHKQDFLTFF